jgi:hypothetical protein
VDDSSQPEIGTVPSVPLKAPPAPAGCLPAALALFALIDVFLLPVIASSPSSRPPLLLVPLAVDAVLLQFGLLGLWAALGPRGLLDRMLTVWLVAACLGGVLLLGLFLLTLHDNRGEPEMFALLLFLPILLFAAQVPIAIVRWLRGWRLTPVDAADISPAAARQFSLADLFTLTTLTAVALAMASLAASTFVRTIGAGRDVAEVKTEMLLVVGAYSLVLAVWNTLATLPGMWVVFVARSQTRGALYFAIYCLALIVLIIAVPSVIYGRTDWEAVVMLSIFVLGGGILVLLGLHGLRLAGYRLDRPLHREATPLAGAVKAVEAPGR